MTPVYASEDKYQNKLTKICIKIYLLRYVIKYTYYQREMYQTLEPEQYPINQPCTGDGTLQIKI